MGSVWSGEPAQEWRSGPWSLQLRDDELADLAYDGRVVLRSVRAVIRDRNWDTATLVVDRVDASGIAVTLHVHSDGLGADLRGIVRAEVRGAGRLRVIADLEAASDFETNRTGLVVRHPPALAGAAMDVRHSDGTVAHSRFPIDRDARQQPPVDIVDLSWSQDDFDLAVRFAGDVFEMDDGHIDANAAYTTHSRPLALPTPYALAAGERVVQAVEITVSDHRGGGSTPGPTRG
ncbi:MAG TPA: hypothetical protein VJU58_07225 [Microbacterium sp.]|nr:hypothetical protein [Microbacterium sp.]